VCPSPRSTIVSPSPPNPVPRLRGVDRGSRAGPGANCCAPYTHCWFCQRFSYSLPASPSNDDTPLVEEAVNCAVGAFSILAMQFLLMARFRWIEVPFGLALVHRYHDAGVVCVPSRNEPFGIVVLEAWNTDNPVVITDTGRPGEYVRHENNGLKIYPTSDSIAGTRLLYKRNLNRHVSIRSPSD
jgi:hypothetical protein